MNDCKKCDHRVPHFKLTHCTNMPTGCECPECIEHEPNEFIKKDEMII